MCGISGSGSADKLIRAGTSLISPNEPAAEQAARTLTSWLGKNSEHPSLFARGPVVEECWLKTNSSRPRFSRGHGVGQRQPGVPDADTPAHVRTRVRFETYEGKLRMTELAQPIVNCLLTTGMLGRSPTAVAA
jgi:hypothetical protein